MIKVEINDPYEDILKEINRKLDILLAQKYDDEFKKPLTKKEAKAYLSISMPTLDALIKSGQLRAFNIGKTVRIMISDIEAYLLKK